MNSSLKSQPLRDPQQINFIMLKRFWSLSKKPFTPLFLTNNIKLDGISTKIKLKVQVCFTLYFRFWEDNSVKSYKMQLPVLLYFVLHQFLYQQRAFFLQLFRTSFNIIWKIFCRKFFFLNWFTLTPHLLNTQNVLSMIKVFCQFSLKCLF